MNRTSNKLITQKMKTVQKIGLMAAFDTIPCGDNASHGELEQLKKQQDPLVSATKRFKDSIQSIHSEIGRFQASNPAKRGQINFVKPNGIPSKFSYRFCS